MPASMLAYLRDYAIQDKSEIVKFIAWVKEQNPQVVGEIGCAGHGTTSWLLTLNPKVLVTVSLPEFLDGVLNEDIALAQTARRYIHDAMKDGVYLHVQADSQQDVIAQRVNHFLALHGVQFDLLFIDGDHSYEGVSRDLHKYMGLVKVGGHIALHDIAAPLSDIEVRKLWEDLDHNCMFKKVWQCVAAGSCTGIGVVKKREGEQ